MKDECAMCEKVEQNCVPVYISKHTLYNNVMI